MKKHKHHIIPRHAGGTDDPSNIIELTIEEHAEAHRVLWEKHRRIEDKVAWNMLSGRNISEEDRIQLSISGYQRFMSDSMNKETWRNNIKKARSRQVMTDKHKDNISTGNRAAWAEGRRIVNRSSETIERHRRAYFDNDMGDILAEARRNSETWRNSVTTEEYRRKKIINSPKRRPIVVDGVEYPSIRQAAKETSYSYAQLRILSHNNTK